MLCQHIPLRSLRLFNRPSDPELEEGAPNAILNKKKDSGPKEQVPC
jgi:hypothetical protein